jgi:hypothetical protein
MSYMGIIMSSLRCCILRASDQSTSHPVNYSTQTLGKYISSYVVLIIKHQNLLSQMARGPFSLQWRLRELDFGRLGESPRRPGP